MRLPQTTKHTAASKRLRFYFHYFILSLFLRNAPFNSFLAAHLSRVYGVDFRLLHQPHKSKNKQKMKEHKQLVCLYALIIVSRMVPRRAYKQSLWQVIT